MSRALLRTRGLRARVRRLPVRFLSQPFEALHLDLQARLDAATLEHPAPKPGDQLQWLACRHDLSLLLSPVQLHPGCQPHAAFRHSLHEPPARCMGLVQLLPCLCFLLYGCTLASLLGVASGSHSMQY